MALLRASGRKAGGRPRSRVLLWTLLAAILCGVLEAGAPVDDMLRAFRNLARQHDASGEIAVVGIDDRTVRQLGRWPIPRRYFAQAADRLREAGAARLYFDIDFAPGSAPQDDALLVQAFSRWRERPVVATRFVIDPISGRRSDHVPTPAMAAVADTANINYRYNHQGAIWTLPYALETAGMVHPSMSAHLAGTSGDVGTAFPIDYAIRIRSIPVYSLADVLAGRVPAAAVRDKTLVVGITSGELGDRFLAPGTGLVPGVYMHVLGAETLREHRPVPLGWVPPLALAFALAWAGTRVRSLKLAGALIGTGFGTLLCGPLLLDELRLPVDVFPALLLLTTASVCLLSSVARKSFRDRGTTNAISGLPNFEAFRHQPASPERPLVAAKIHNFAHIVSALAPAHERALVEQIASRLTLGAQDIVLHQGDEGLFAWFAEEGARLPIGDHLDALHALFRSPIVVGGQRLDLSITFGIDPPGDRETMNRLGSALVAADKAVAAGVRWDYYDPAQLKDAGWKLSLLSQLDGAIDSGELWIAYQPKVEVRSGRIVGAEALARWTHPVKGPISPDEFIGAAEQGNRIDRLTMHVLDRAIAAAAQINGHDMPFGIAVNLSTRLLDDRALPAAILAVLARHRLPPERLTLEITETAALATGGASLDTLHALRRHGIAISIDDYGTGQSTLDYLKRVPATEIKIDKSFIQLIDDSQSDRLMVRSTIELAHSLGLRVVAEGVEWSTTLDRLAALNCDVAQGYWIGRPMAFTALARMLLERKRVAA